MIPSSLNLIILISLMDNNTFLRRAKSVSYLNAISLREKLKVGHFLLLTKIVASKIRGRPLPNVKWLQTELQISFTKVKSIIENLESRGLIAKVSDPNDKRRKFLDVTEKGYKYICDLNESIDEIGK